jgi:inorganic pyrophosphatase
MNLWHEVSRGKNIPEEVNVIIEIPKNSPNKYEIDKDTGLIKLDRVLYGAQYYPFDYGFAPQTLWHDGDALDVMVMTTFPLAPGMLVEVRPIAVLGMTDGGEGDDKIIAVPASDPRYDDYTDLEHIGAHRQKEIIHFFETYKMLQNKAVTCNGFRDAASARAAVLESVQLYKEKFSS